MTSSRLSAGTWKFRMLHLFSSLCIGRFVSLLANFYNKAVNSDAIEDSESMDIIGEFNAMQSRLLTNSSDVFTNLFDEVFPRIFLSVSSWKRKQTSEFLLVQNRVVSHFASWKRNQSSYKYWFKKNRRIEIWEWWNYLMNSLFYVLF